MPNYDYHCPKCGNKATLRRLFSEFDSPAECLSCGQEMQRQFVANGNIQVPIAFRQCLTGGAPGGGQYSWSDFHGDVTEKQMAHMPNVIPFNEYMSKPGVRDPHDNGPRVPADNQRQARLAAREVAARTTASPGEG